MRAGLRVLKGGVDADRPGAEAPATSAASAASAENVSGAPRAGGGSDAGAETIKIGVAPDSPELARLKKLSAAPAHGVPNPMITFGQYQGKYLHQLAQEDPEYLKWLMTGAKTPEMRMAAQKLVEYLGLSRPPRRVPPRGRRPVARRF
ncbi:MAG TPA: hypothetical protein VFN74_12670 [Chloroflexota bacterium]|nr:hypothetical protein [Chloroflexota bacterium]